MSAQFSYTNKTKSEHTNTIVKILPENYAYVVDEPDQVTLTNTTTAIDQPELITYQHGILKKIPTKVSITNPTRVAGGIQYGVRLDVVLRDTSSTGDTNCDLPIVLNLTVKHPCHTAITSEVIDELYERLQGMLYNETTGKSRFNDLMRGAIRPSK